MKADFDPEKYLTCRALVLRAEDAKGANRRLTLLTAEQGCIVATAYGSGKGISPLAAATRLFCYSECTLLQKRGHYRIEDALVIEAFSGIGQELRGYALACYLAELLLHTVPAEQESPAAMQLTLCAFSAIASGKRDPALIKAAFELRLLSDAGFAPSLECCGGDCDRFYPETGEVRCPVCAERPLTYDRRAIPITAGALEAMRHVQASAYRRVFAFSLGDESLRSMARACGAFAAAQAAHTGPALEFYQKIMRENLP